MNIINIHEYLQNYYNSKILLTLCYLLTVIIVVVASKYQTNTERAPLFLLIILLIFNCNPRMMPGETINDSEGEIEVSFGYHCNCENDDSCSRSNHIDSFPSGGKLRRASRSFSCLSGAALSANATLANTSICNGLIGSEKLPSLDSPKSFRRIPSSTSLTKTDFFPPNETLDYDPVSPKRSTLSRSESFLNAMEVQVAGGAAGEDRVQAVCSEENGWLFCAIYDGFNGRDAADFLAGTLYETVAFHLNLLDWNIEQESVVLNRLQLALSQAEDKFLQMVEQEMVDRPDLVSIGSCVLVVLLHGNHLYLLNVGDSRVKAREGLQAVQLTDTHTFDNNNERIRLLKDHPDDPYTIMAGRVKGKVKVTRAFGVGYLKKKKMNDALMGILRVRNLISPPYVSLNPSLKVRKISNCDHFVVLGSDGLFDYFDNIEVVNLVHSYITRTPFGDPAKYLVEQLVSRAADSAGFSMDELMSIPAGRRRKYHDDVTVIVIVLGTNNRTSKASLSL
ncbi:Protein phosphatase 2C/pyruvate dehydrogenase (lipoamide) phosphatase [Handroanthus impetiginosus]|uniref:Protein phosphatase 2C/pyruvate dehydrogenase (Lipoamide) phosphatase n=1 Tax=Handroanthus impetiginosus TaxID=429701 RepID=A0A2G9GS59_9LAMI|nr:Protein phosphatase 2C/pyruvate dehydrogenase (lipoamide) phosphatase [Handroanthus impetiginosus]